MISAHTKAGLAAAKARGQKLGVECHYIVDEKMCQHIVDKSSLTIE